MMNRNDSVLSSALSQTRKIFEPVNNRPGKPVEIIPSKAEEVSFGEGKKRRKSWREKDVSDWGNLDIWNYFKTRFYNKFGYTVGYAFQPGCQAMLRCGEELKKSLGEWPSNQIMKGFIDWFIDERLPDLIGVYSVFKVSYVYHPKNPADFMESIGHKRVHVLQKAVADENNEEKKQVVFKGAIVNFACEQGMILLLAYFKSQGKSEEESAKLVSTAICMVDKLDRYSEFASATRDNGPYPSSIEFRNMDRAISKITELSGRRVSLLRFNFEDDADNFEFRKET